MEKAKGEREEMVKREEEEGKERREKEKTEGRRERYICVREKDMMKKIGRKKDNDRDIE